MLLEKGSYSLFYMTANKKQTQPKKDVLDVPTIQNNLLCLPSIDKTGTEIDTF